VIGRLASGRRVAPVVRLVVAGLTLSTALLLVATVAAPTRARADGVTDRQKQVEAALKAASADLDSSSAATIKAASALKAVQAQLSTAQQRLAGAQRQLTGARATAASAARDAAAARTALTGAQREVTASQRRVDAKQQQIDSLLRLRYESGPSEDVTLLLGSGEPGRYLERAGLLQTVVRGRGTQLVELRNARGQLAASEAVLRDRHAAVARRDVAARRALDQVQQLVATAQQANDELATLAAARNATLNAAEAALAQDRAQVAQLQQESANIAALIRQRQQPAASTAAPLSASSAGLIYPVQGPVTSEFGMRHDPVTGKYALHAGMDFGVPTGTPVKAAKAGTVIYAGSETGYGNYTCIDHGGGFSTCYAHQSVIQVSVGQHVAQGQVIGLSGSTGYSTGPHLHFETRINGTPENPRRYL